MSREASPHDDVVDSETVPLLNILSLQGNVDCNLLMHIACMYQVQRVLAAARARKEKVLALGLPATPTKKKPSHGQASMPPPEVLSKHAEAATPSKPKPAEVSKPQAMQVATPVKPQPSTPGPEPGQVKTRVSSKRSQQATPLPAKSPSIPTPGQKHIRGDGDESVHSERRELFADVDDASKNSALAALILVQIICIVTHITFMSSR